MKVLTETIQGFNGYRLVGRSEEPRYVLYDRSGGPVIQGDTRGIIYVEALNALDDYDSTAILGPYTTGDIEAMRSLVNFIEATSRATDMRVAA